MQGDVCAAVAESTAASMSRSTIAAQPQPGSGGSGRTSSAASPADKPKTANKPETVKDRKARLRRVRDRDARARAAGDKPESLVDFELPEVEIVRKELHKQMVGRTIEHAEAASMKCLRSYFARIHFTKRLPGETVLSVSRTGLYLFINFASGTMLVLSLGASGSPRLHPERGDPPEDGTELVITIADGGELHFVDPVGTGQLFLVPEGDLELNLPEIERYGHDPLKPISWMDMGRRLLGTDTELKTLFTDEEFLVGIGEIYSDEILFESGLRYDRPASSLNSSEMRRLHGALVRTIFDSMKYGGTSLPQRPFVNPAGRVGAYANHIKVWGRESQLSPRSRAPILRKKYRDVWTYFCETQV